MKNSFLAVLLVAFSFLCNCHKDNFLSKHGSQTLPGSWELRSYYGGYGLTGGGSFEPGNGTIFTFTDDKYVYYSEGIAHDSGTYQVSTAPNPNTGEESTAIIFNGDAGFSMCYSIENDELKLYRGAIAADGTVETYVRIMNAAEIIAKKH